MKLLGLWSSNRCNRCVVIESNYNRKWKCRPTRLRSYTSRCHCKKNGFVFVNYISSIWRVREVITTQRIRLHYSHARNDRCNHQLFTNILYILSFSKPTPKFRRPIMIIQFLWSTFRKEQRNKVHPPTIDTRKAVGIKAQSCRTQTSNVDRRLDADVRTSLWRHRTRIGICDTCMKPVRLDTETASATAR